MPAHPHRWRRALAWAALILLLVVLAIAGYGAWRWQHIRDAVGIVGLDWQGAELSLAGLRLKQLALEQQAADGRRLQLAADAVQLDWSLGLRAPRLDRLAVGELRLVWQAALAPSGQASRLPDLEQLAALLARLPSELTVAHIAADLPCPAARCQLTGSLHLQQAGAALLPASVHLDLTEGAHRLRLDGELRGSPDAAELELALRLDDREHLAARATLLRAGAARELHGRLQLPARPPVPWLHTWLAQTLGAAAAPLAQLPDDLELTAEWQLRLPDAWQPEQGLPRQLTIDRLHLQGRLPQWRREALTLRAVDADLPLTGQWQAPRLQLTAAAGAQLAARRLEQPDLGLRLDDLRASLAGLQFDRGEDGTWRLAGPLALKAGRVEHAQLKPQRWSWQGTLSAKGDEQRLAGRLGNAAGLALQLDGGVKGGALDLQTSLPPLALAGGNPLAATLSAWPALLELSAGSLVAEASLQLPADARPPTATLAVELNGASGVYDRTELQALDAHLDGRLEDGQLWLELPAVRAQRVNSGVPLGPLEARLRYVTTPDALQAGTLILYKLNAGLLGGQARARPDAFAVAQRPLTLHLEATDLELAELLEVYPAEGLSGSGRLDGALPLRLERDGLHIDQGRLAARPPGGVLQVRSERIRAYGQRNPALRLVTLALEDFRYDRLDSQVDYAPTGELHVLLHLSGNNPALERGRQVNLTINLEENVPALLTSLQLSGRVNEAIQRRVQQSLQRRD